MEFPWGACPFPCGGFGRLTSIVQVANGIPKWIGEQLFPETFQSPCRANKEPLVRQAVCNTHPCEDCSVFLEGTSFESATFGWVFFRPSQDSDYVQLVAPHGVSFPAFPVAHISPQGETQAQLPPGFEAARTLTQMPVDLTCPPIRNSFGDIDKCASSKSQQYHSSNILTMKLKSLIEPPKAPTSKDYPSAAQPEWLSIPMYLGKASELEARGNFYLWLYSSTSLREPEVFKCQVKTALNIPEACYYKYRPLNPTECQTCAPDSGVLFEAYRSFVAAKNGGSCSISPDQRVTEIETPVSVECALACRDILIGDPRIPVGEDIQSHRFSIVNGITSGELAELLDRRMDRLGYEQTRKYFSNARESPATAASESQVNAATITAVASKPAQTGKLTDEQAAEPAQSTQASQTSETASQTVDDNSMSAEQSESSSNQGMTGGPVAEL
eukprot:GHVT01077759.1.p1 GENE.GHVT01077759.1~~GHVT01077759.1.p1  ORF type:complete len:443 (+),score=40.15 GHVT01077759.1:1231-2559(+)